MKLYISIFLIIFITSCSGSQTSENPAPQNAAIRAKNQRTAMMNEITDITQTAQRIEKEGREMDFFRKIDNEENMNQCRLYMEERQKEISTLEARIEKIPGAYSRHLTPVIADLNSCVSCAKTAVGGCINARATINKAIAEIYRQ
jgi:hypothetical protein